MVLLGDVTGKGVAGGGADVARPLHGADRGGLRPGAVGGARARQRGTARAAAAGARDDAGRAAARRRGAAGRRRSPAAAAARAPRAGPSRSGGPACCSAPCTTTSSPRTSPCRSAPGDVLLLYTDGVTDTPGEHDRFGEAAAARRADRRAARPGRGARRGLRGARRLRDRRHAGRPGDARGAARVSLAADANAGRVALVTGGGSGIGRATALAFARSGARVAVCGRRPEPLEETRALVEAAGGECLAVAADIREPDAVGALVGEVLERFGTIDVLVNNAGGQFVAPAEKISDNGWRAVERVTVDATWGVTRTVAERAMIPGRGGLIVFIGFSPRRGTPGMAHAAAGRAAVENLAAGPRARVEPPPDPLGLRRAGVDPQRGARRLRPRAGRRLGAQHPAGAARPRGGGRVGDRLPRVRGRRVHHRDDDRGRRRRRRLGHGRAAARRWRAARDARAGAARPLRRCSRPPRWRSSARPTTRPSGATGMARGAIRGSGAAARVPRQPARGHGARPAGAPLARRPPGGAGARRRRGAARRRSTRPSTRRSRPAPAPS